VSAHPGGVMEAPSVGQAESEDEELTKRAGAQSSFLGKGPSKGGSERGLPKTAQK